MAVLKVSSLDQSRFINKLSGVIDFNKDLPLNVFIGQGFVFWFFERPLVCYFDVFSGLVSASVSSFKSDVFIKFTGDDPLGKTCFSVDGSNLDEDVFWINKKFESFFDGTVGYPILIFNGTLDWIAYESAYEEFGVIAVKSAHVSDDFYEYLKSNFISFDELSKVASGVSAESITAKALISSYLI